MKKSNIIWNTFGSVFYSICQWIITILVVHIADFEVAGYLSLAMTMSSSFSAISLFSMRNYQVSDVKGEFATRQYVNSRIWTCVLAFVACALFAFWGNSLYQVLCIDAFMLIRVAEALVDVLHGVNQKYDRYDYIGISFTIRGIITVVGFVVGLIVTNDLLITLIVIAVLNLFAAIVYDVRKTNQLEHLEMALWDKRIPVLLKNCLPLVLIMFCLSLQNLIPKKILEFYYGAEQLGIYSSIASPTLIIQVFSSVVFSPFLPMFSRIYYNGEIKIFRKLLHKTYLMLVVLTAVVTAGAMLLGRIGLTILFGKEILEYYHLFMPIVYCTLLTGMCWIISAIVILLRKIKELLIAMIIDFGICVACVCPVVRYYGQNGVSYVQLISLPILVLLMIAICEITTIRANRK